MKTPTVGFAMSLYNQSAWVEEAIDSALSQTVPPEQIVVVDDGSTDDSRDRVRALNSPRVKLVESNRSGVSNVLNTAVKHLDTDLIAIQACDDVSFPERIERQLESLVSNASTAVFGQPRVIDELSDDMPDEHAPEFFAIHDEADDVLRRFFYAGNFLCASSALLDRSSFLKFGGFHPGLLHLQDFRLWIQFASIVEPIVLTDRIVKYRRTSFGGNLSSSTNDKRMRAEFAYVYRQFFDHCSLERLKDAFPEVANATSSESARIQLLLNHKDHLVYQEGVERLLIALESCDGQLPKIGRAELTATDIFEIVGKSDVDRREHLSVIAQHLRIVAPWMLTDENKAL